MGIKSGDVRRNNELTCDALKNEDIYVPKDLSSVFSYKFSTICST